MSSKHVGIEEARKRLGDLVTAVQQGADVVLTRNGKPTVRLVAIKEPTMTTTTTPYGTWANIDEANRCIEDHVAGALGEFATDYDVDAVVVDYRAAINEVLPVGVSLNGNEFYGPADREIFDGYPTNERGCLDIKAIVESVDFWEIAGRHDKAA